MSDPTTGWRPICTLKPAPVEDYILWNGVRRFVGWLDDDGWHAIGNAEHNDLPEDPQPTMWHPWPEPPHGE